MTQRPFFTLASPRALAAIAAADPSALRSALLAGEAPDAIDEQGNTLLRLLLDSCSEAGIARERALGVYKEERSLHKIWIARCLLEFGANARSVGPDGQTPLHLACSLADSRLASILLAFPGDLNPLNANGETPLMAAAAKGRARCVLLLLQAGACANVELPRSVTPLHHAAALQDLRLARDLISHQADACALDPDGLSPWQVSEKISGFDSSVTALLFQAFVANERSHLGAQARSLAPSRPAPSL